jgi:hypothetical protein
MRVKQFLVTAAMSVAMFASVLSPVRAQQATAPFATVVIAPVGQTMKDVSWLLTAVNFPEISGFVEIMGESYTNGLDKSRPLGVLVSMDNGMPSPLVCIPSKDHKVFFEALEQAGMSADDLGDGLYEFSVGPQLVVAKVANGWIYVGQSEDAVENTPKNPGEMFSIRDLDKRYSLAIRLDLKELPENMKDAAIENLRSGFENAMEQQSAGQSEEQQAMAKEMGEVQMAQLEELINSTQELIVGFAIDRQKQQISLDGALQYAAGSKLAKQMESQGKLKSDYTGLVLPGSSVEFRVTSLATNEDDKKIAKQSFRNSMKQAESQLENSNAPEPIATAVKKFLRGFGEVFEKTIDEGVIDAASSVSVADDTLRILSGARVADGRKVEKEVKDLIGALPKSNDVTVDFDFAKHNGFNLHRVNAKIPSGNEEAQAAFGDSVQVFVATGEKSVIFCLDPTGEAGVKAAIDAMAAKKAVEVSPFTGIVRVASLLGFAQTIKPNPILENVIQAFSQFKDKDTVSINSTILPRGMITRVTIDEGVLKSIGTAAKTGGRNAGF